MIFKNNQFHLQSNHSFVIDLSIILVDLMGNYYHNSYIAQDNKNNNRVHGQLHAFSSVSRKRFIFLLREMLKIIKVKDNKPHSPQLILPFNPLSDNPKILRSHPIIPIDMTRFLRKLAEDRLCLPPGQVPPLAFDKKDLFCRII